MFVDQTKVVKHPFDEVEGAFLEGRTLLPELMKVAVEEENDVTARMGVGFLSKKVSVRAGVPLREPGRLVVPIRVMALGAEGLFPQLDADLEVRPAAGGTTVRLAGAYRPPFGQAGEVIDKLVLRSLALVTIRNFLEQLAVRLDHPSRTKAM